MINNKTYHGNPVSSSQNVPPISQYFETYLSLNPKTGYLTFDVYRDSPIKGRVPVPNAKITISKLLGDGYYFSKVIKTNEDGETDPVALPTVSRDLSLTPNEGRVYSVYDVSVEVPGYQRKDIYGVEIFEGITSVQRVKMEQNGETENLQAFRAKIAMK